MKTTTGSETSSLLEAIQRLERRSATSEWVAALAPRKRAEVEFHEPRSEMEAHETETTVTAQYSNRKFYATAGRAQKYFFEAIDRYSPGKIVLDYACGDGVCTIRAAKAGAALAVGLDITPASVENAKRMASKEKLNGTTRFLVGDCEDTGLPSSSVDVAICSGMLHHLDLSYAFPELRRILKPGGVAICSEALNHNPIIKAYRRLTPELRTDWEKHHILGMREIRFARKFFDVHNMRFFSLASVATTPFRNARIFEPMLRTANAVDDALLRVPGLRLMAWMFTFELVKRSEE